MDEVTNLQCDYLEALEKCERLEKELSKSRTMSKSFEALQKHAINLELALQQCKEQIKNDKSFKENQSNVFLKEREQYFEIQDLKAQLQDKGIAISELKKLIEKMKGKSVETKFEKSSVIRQPNAFKSQRQSILGKPATFLDSLAKTDFSKSNSLLLHIRQDGENLDKMKEKVIHVFLLGYSTTVKRLTMVFNKRTVKKKNKSNETIHVNFDELPQMASDHVSSDPGPQCSTTVLEQDSLSPSPQSQENVSQTTKTITTSNELELLYSLMFSELLNGNSNVMSKSSTVHAADNPDKRQQHNTTHTSTTTDVADPPPLNIQSTHQTPTHVPTVTAPENIIQAETDTKNAQFDDDKFINIFSNPEQRTRENIHSSFILQHAYFLSTPTSANVVSRDHPLNKSLEILLNQLEQDIS
ncbi:hypothetical protein Tco_1407260 [Tanacetum coccineum]